MIVSRVGSVGFRKAYRSVLLAAGSPAISGASRWLEARTLPTDVAVMSTAPVRAATRDRVDTRKFSSCVVSGTPRPSGSGWDRACDASRLLTGRCRRVFAPMDGSDQRTVETSAAERREQASRLGGARRREAGVDRQGPAQVPTRSGALAQGRLDRAGVIAQDRVDGAEAERLRDPRRGLTIAAEPVEGPGDGVRGADRRGRRVRGPGMVDRVGRVAVVRLEQREVDVDHDARGLEQANLGTGQVVAP